MPIPATNRFRVAHGAPIIASDNVNAPDTKVYTAFGVEVDGVRIGRITDWTNPPRTREFALQKELNPDTFGLPVDGVPGGVADGFDIQFNRTEVWAQEIEKAFGAQDIYTFLTEQNLPITVEHFIRRGRREYSRTQYLGCYWGNISEDAFSAEGNGIITVSATLNFVSKRVIVSRA